MIEVSVVNSKAEPVGKIRFDEAALGGLVDGKLRAALLKQAVVRYNANLRQGTVKTKTRAMVEGSTRKLYRQKGTGNARRGAIRTPIMKGGGHAKAKLPRDFSQDLPRKARRLATRQALLSKFLDNQAVVVDKIELPQIKTRAFVELLSALSIERGCVVAVPAPGADEAARRAHRALYLSARNLPQVEVRPVGELNAREVLLRRQILFTKDALLSLVGAEAYTAS
jgi:large subunit ribosomal protein L4